MARSMTNIKSATNKCQTIGTYVILDLARTYHQHMTPAPNQHQKKQSECSATYKMEQVIDLWIKYTDTFTHTARTNLITNKATHHMEFHIRNFRNKRQQNKGKQLSHYIHNPSGGEQRKGEGNQM
eukprot:373824_1